MVYLRNQRKEKWHTERLITAFYVPFLNLRPDELEDLCEGLDFGLLAQFWKDWLDGLVGVLDLKYFHDILLNKADLKSEQFEQACENINNSADILNMLVYLISDIEDGNQSTFLKFAKRKMGRNPDPPIIKRFKSSIALQYRLLRETEFESTKKLKGALDSAPLAEVLRKWKSAAMKEVSHIKVKPIQLRRMLRTWVGFMQVVSMMDGYPFLHDVQLYQKWNR